MSVPHLPYSASFQNYFHPGILADCSRCSTPVVRHFDSHRTPRVAPTTTVELQIAIDAPSRPRAPENGDFQGAQGIDQERIVRVGAAQRADVV
jgi:hypothetical protein